MTTRPMSAREDEPLLNPNARSYRTRSVIILVALVIVITSVAGGLIGLPFVRLIEDAICQEHYASRPVEGGLFMTSDLDEAHCKVDVVQARLAYILAIQEMLDAIAGFTFALPYGLVADRIGRTKVLALSFLGIWLAGCWAGLVVWQRNLFPIWTIWFSTAFQTIGGGPGIPMTMIYTIITDVQAEAERTNTFFYISVCGMIADLIAPTLAASLMTVSPWLPFTIGISAMAFAMLLTLSIPETYHARTRITSSPRQGPIDAQPKPYGLLHHLNQILAMFKSRSLCLIFVSFVGEQLILKNSGFAMRYVSKRFSWPLSRFGYFMSARALVGILIYLLILPRISSFLQHRMLFPPLRKDLLLARTMGIILAIGLFLAAGPTLGCVLSGLLLVTIGSSSTTICRSIAAHFVDSRHVASMYTFLNLLNTAGAILASPLLASTFVLGMRWGGDWQGLPYLCLGVLGTVSAIALFLIRRGTGEVEEMEDDGE
ncbi:MFS general substrate transporter [Aureobasidium pullulans]|uniref:MFS general substrate transporter n=1 Tax=Aureobasidium pullulans TaxID=5580 RepID=A0A4V6TLS7_AURPU|nr:MFS general substrate transporter [Aureobasidium pullulans]TIA68603.1 MFS general substrate transporter [Aureobasidium pullulans]